MANVVKTKAPLLAGKTIIQTGGRNQKIKLEVNRNTVIRIKRDESRKQGDKNTHKEMAPMTAIQKIEDYKIPTPYKEILIALVNRKEGYEALDYLAEKFSIHMGYWTYGRRLKESLQMFRKSNLDFYAGKG